MEGVPFLSEVWFRPNLRGVTLKGRFCIFRGMSAAGILHWCVILASVDRLLGVYTEDVRGSMYFVKSLSLLLSL